jgi:hypothetical protein
VWQPHKQPIAVSSRHSNQLNNRQVRSQSRQEHLLASSFLFVGILQLDSRCTDLRDISYWKPLRKSVEKLPNLVKVEENIWHFTRTPKRISHCWQRHVRRNAVLPLATFVLFITLSTSTARNRTRCSVSVTPLTPYTADRAICSSAMQMYHVIALRSRERAKNVTLHLNCLSCFNVSPCHKQRQFYGTPTTTP